MRVEFRTARYLIQEGYKFAKEPARVNSFYALNTRILTEYIQLKYRVSEIYGQNPDDYYLEYIYAYNLDTTVVTSFHLKDEHNKEEFMNSNEINFNKIKLNSGFEQTDIEFDYKHYELKHKVEQPNVPVEKLQLNFHGCYFKEVRSFEKLDKQIKNLFELNDAETLQVRFLLTFSNGKTFEIPYKLTKADMTYLSVYGILKSYSNAMRNCVRFLGKEVKNLMNKVQLDALEMSKYKF